MYISCHLLISLRSACNTLAHVNITHVCYHLVAGMQGSKLMHYLNSVKATYTRSRVYRIQGLTRKYTMCS